MSSKKTGVTLTKKDIISVALEHYEKTGVPPTLRDLSLLTAKTRSGVRHFFNTNKELWQAIGATKQKHKFNHKKSSYFVTSIFSFQSIDPRLVQTLKNWEKAFNGQVIIIPLDGVAKKEVYDNFYVLDKIIHLNENISVFPFSNKYSKAINAKTISIAAHNSRSVIFPGVRLEKMSIPTDTGKLPHLIYSTGLCSKIDPSLATTLSEYRDIQESELSGIIVDIPRTNGNKIFLAREAMIDHDYSFVDFSKNYSGKGEKNVFWRVSHNGIKKEQIKAISLGDAHVEEIDQEYNKAMLEVARKNRAEIVVIHDIFSFRGPSHHTSGDELKNFMLARELNLKDDIEKLVRFIEDWSKAAKNVYIVRSNHDSHVYKSVITKSMKVYDLGLYHELSAAILRGEDAMLFLIKYFGHSLPKNVKWLKKDEALVLKNKVGSLSLHHHGDIGADGSKSNGTGLKSLSIASPCAIYGHTHSPAIMPSSNSRGGEGNGGIWVNGTMIDLFNLPGYVEGPSSWLNTSTVVFNGGRFLRTQLTFIRPKKTSKGFL